MAADCLQEHMLVKLAKQVVEWEQYAMIYVQSRACGAMGPGYPWGSMGAHGVYFIRV